jgi:hypothetical protein
VNLPAPDFESPFLAAARSEDAKRIAAALGALAGCGKMLLGERSRLLGRFLADSRRFGALPVRGYGL